MKLWTLITLSTVSLLIISGCAVKPTPKKEATVDSTLPLVELTQDGTVVDMNAIAFEWKSFEDSRVKGVYVYKLQDNSTTTSSDDYYDTVNGRFTTHYLDTKVKPATQYRYYFKTFSDKAESVKSNIATLNTLPVLESVSWIHSIQSMPRSAKIIWRPHSNQKVKAYIIERKTLEENKWEKLATVNGRLNAEFIDKGLKDNYVYKYCIRAVTYDNIISNPSAEVKVVTKALPLEVNNIQASRNLPKEIKVSWDKSLAKDFAKYNVYRSDKANGNYELIAKLLNNYFTDKIDEDGKQYFYRVSAVDKDGLESKHDENSIQGLTLAKPNAPVILEVKLVNSQVVLVWNKVDPRTIRYIVSKRYKKGWFDELTQDFKVSGTTFTDANIEPGVTYYYRLFGIDENSIKSAPSIEVEVVSPKSKVGTAPASVPASRISEPVDASVIMPIEEVEEIMPTQDFN